MLSKEEAYLEKQDVTGEQQEINASATDRIKQYVDPSSLPAEVDFWVPGRNTLITSPVTYHFRFNKDIESIQNEYFDRAKELSRLFIPTIKYGEVDPWIRDFITIKTSKTAYVFNEGVKYIATPTGYADQYDPKIIKYNQHVSPYVSKNTCHPRWLGSHDQINSEHVKPTEVAAPGGNFFHCVNSKGDPYIITGELALVSQNKIKQKHQNEKSSSIGLNSGKKYSKSDFTQKEEIISQRQINKQILKGQSTANILVVPNAFFYHLDLEMLVLPNGVVLLHSPEESLLFLKGNKDNLSNFLSKEYNPKCGYDFLYAKATQHVVDTQKLFDITKRKLEKHGFIVIPVCGFLTLTDNITGLIATGFGGLPVVLPKDGRILYTMPPNEKWYADYFIEVLKKAGVSVVKTIVSMNLAYFAHQQGFLRCQTHTIPNTILLDQSLDPENKLEGASEKNVANQRLIKEEAQSIRPDMTSKPITSVSAHSIFKPVSPLSDAIGKPQAPCTDHQTHP